MNHGLPIEFHVDLYVRDCRPLLVDVAFDLVVSGIELEKVDWGCLLCLPFEELGHELYLLKLSRELHFITFEDGTLLLHLYHELVHTIF